MVVGRSCHRWIDVVWVDCYIDVCGRAASRCDEPSQRENTEVVFLTLVVRSPAKSGSSGSSEKLGGLLWTFLWFSGELFNCVLSSMIYIYISISIWIWFYILYIYIYIWASTQSIERVSKVLVSCSEQPEIRCSGVVQRREAKLWTVAGTALRAMSSSLDDVVVWV